MTDRVESIGSYLAEQRRLRGISIEQLADQTCIPLRSLERLEGGTFDDGIDGFVRGFVRTVAEALGLDPDETVNRTLSEPGENGEHAGPKLSLRRIFATVAVVAFAGLAIALVQTLAITRFGNAADTTPDASIVRRDPVRALAEAQGVAALGATPAAAFANARPRDVFEAPDLGVAEPERAAARPARP